MTSLDLNCSRVHLVKIRLFSIKRKNAVKENGKRKVIPNREKLSLFTQSVLTYVRTYKQIGGL